MGWGDTFMNLTYHMKEKAILKGDSTANETENCKDLRAVLNVHVFI